MVFALSGAVSIGVPFQTEPSGAAHNIQTESKCGFIKTKGNSGKYILQTTTDIVIMKKEKCSLLCLQRYTFSNGNHSLFLKLFVILPASGFTVKGSFRHVARRRRLLERQAFAVPRPADGFIIFRKRMRRTAKPDTLGSGSGNALRLPFFMLSRSPCATKDSI